MILRRLLPLILLSTFAIAQSGTSGGVRSTGTPAANDCTKFVSKNVITTTGSPCGSGAGTVTSVLGTANQINSDGSTSTPTLSLSNTLVLPGTLTGSDVSLFTTTTAATQFLSLKNTTAAVVGTSQGSPVQALCGRAFHGSADVEDCMTFSELPGNGNDAAIAFTIGHTGTSTGVTTVNVPALMRVNSTSGAFLLNATNTGLFVNSGTPAIQVGGTTAVSFSNTGVIIGTNLRTSANIILFSSTAPTISSGFGTSPTISISNGTASFRVNVGTGGVATAGVIALPTATTGWNCAVNDITAAAANTAYNTRQTASTTATVSVQNQTTSTGTAIAWGASDILALSCFAN